MQEERMERLRKSAMALPLLPGVYIMHDITDMSSMSARRKRSKTA